MDVMLSKVMLICLINFFLLEELLRINTVEHTHKYIHVVENKTQILALIKGYRDDQ